jgi:hypothetical protein
MTQTELPRDERLARAEARVAREREKLRFDFAKGES